MPVVPTFALKSFCSISIPGLAIIEDWPKSVSIIRGLWVKVPALNPNWRLSTLNKLLSLVSCIFAPVIATAVDESVTPGAVDKIALFPERPLIVVTKSTCRVVLVTEVANGISVFISVVLTKVAPVTSVLPFGPAPSILTNPLSLEFFNDDIIRLLKKALEVVTWVLPAVPLAIAVFALAFSTSTVLPPSPSPDKLLWDKVLISPKVVEVIVVLLAVVLTVALRIFTISFARLSMIGTSFKNTEESPLLSPSISPSDKIS